MNPEVKKLHSISYVAQVKDTGTRVISYWELLEWLNSNKLEIRKKTT